MKKAILIGAALLATSSAILLANNNTAAEECCSKPTCEQGICKPGDPCPDTDECCKK